MLLSNLTMAGTCANYENSELSICVGDFVNIGDEYVKGAIVTGINHQVGLVSIESINDGSTGQKLMREVNIGKGCIDFKKMKVCVGDFVNVGDEYVKGAEVSGVNPNTLMVGLKSLNIPVQGEVHIDEVNIGRGCLYGVCVGDLVYVEDYLKGAEVTGINPNTLMVGLKSFNNSTQGEKHVDEVYVTKKTSDYSKRQRSLDSYMP